jgi:DNA polymerase-3 subunit alpha
MRLEILPPDINASSPHFTVEGGGIRFGLSAIKGVGDAAVEPILAARASRGRFEGIADCLRSLPARAVNHKVMECLVKAGCFDGFGLPRGPLLEHLSELMELAAREREQSELGQGFLFDDFQSDSFEASLRGAPDGDPAERLGWERDVLGFFLSGHPLDGYADQLRRFADCAVAELPRRLESGAERVTVAGRVSGLKVIPIKREGPNHGRRMGVCELEDPTGSVRVVAFPDAFDRAERALVDGSAVLVVAALKGEGDHVELSAEEVSALDGLAARRAAALRVVVNLDEADEASLEELREFLLDHPGDLAVRFELLRRGRFRARLVPPPALAVDASQETLDALHERLGSGWYEFEYDTPIRNGGSRSRPEPVPPPVDEGDGDPLGVVN